MALLLCFRQHSPRRENVSQLSTQRGELKKKEVEMSGQDCVIFASRHPNALYSYGNDWIFVILARCRRVMTVCMLHKASS
jgi:hypothetical protein